MVRANLEGVFPTYKTLRDSTRRTYWYHRATGKRLHGDPGSAEFIADYAAAEKTIRDRHSGTFNALIRSYTTSIEFEQQLAASTQSEYKRMLTKAEAEFGTMLIAALDDPRVRKDMLARKSRAGIRAARGRQSPVSNLGNAHMVGRPWEAHRQQPTRLQAALSR